jgi:hypothetical protein
MTFAANNWGAQLSQHQCGAALPQLNSQRRGNLILRKILENFMRAIMVTIEPHAL